MQHRPINKHGLDLIKAFEGCKLTAYLCPAGVWTIGYGSTGPHVRKGLTITQDAAEALLREDLERFERGVSTAISVPLTDNQFAALVSLAFNVGTGAFSGSTLVRKLNANDFAGAADQFARWNKAGGRVLAGLTRRRAAERALFETPVARPSAPTIPAPVMPVSKPARTLWQRLFGRGR